MLSWASNPFPSKCLQAERYEATLRRIRIFSFCDGSFFCNFTALSHWALSFTNSGIILDFRRLVVAQVCQADRGACAFVYKDAPYSDELIERFLVRFEVLKLGRRWVSVIRRCWLEWRLVDYAIKCQSMQKWRSGPPLSLPHFLHHIKICQYCDASFFAVVALRRLSIWQLSNVVEDSVAASRPSCGARWLGSGNSHPWKLLTPRSRMRQTIWFESVYLIERVAKGRRSKNPNSLHKYLHF